ncbi:MAG: hypothetical protein AB1696_09615 [Planctomycetota bacterium]
MADGWLYYPLFGAFMGCLFGRKILMFRVAFGMAMTIGGVVLLAAAGSARSMDLPDIRSVEPDLQIPPLSEGQPAAGKRVRQTLPEYEDTDVHHILYLPTDWRPDSRYPVIVEYAGNQWRNDRTGDACTGEVEDSKLGYGMSGGRGFIWVCMPYVNAAEKRNEATWWGDVAATVDYCKKAVRQVCEKWCGDSSAVILTGFSRGAIACNYIGLHDDEIAGLWLAFAPYSHYDGVREWSYPRSDRASVLERLARLRDRAVFVCQERGVEATRQYIESTGVKAPFTYQPIGFHNHNDAWVLRPVAERQALRTWLKQVLEARPGREGKD